jgi:hypothetical protein
VVFKVLGRISRKGSGKDVVVVVVLARGRK